MPQIDSIDLLKDYCFRRLGAPVINIEVEEQQARDRIFDAIQYFIERHFDGQTQRWMPITVTSADVQRKAVQLDRSIVNVLEVFDPAVDPNAVGAEDFEKLNYLIAQSDLFDFTHTSGREHDLTSYDFTFGYISLLRRYFNLTRSYKFNASTGLIYFPTAKLKAGNYFLIRAMVASDPSKATNMLNSRWLKEYASALIKVQWGSNLKKFDGVIMAGGVTLNGKVIFDEGMEWKKDIEDQLKKEFQLPVDPMWG